MLKTGEPARFFSRRRRGDGPCRHRRKRRHRFCFVDRRDGEDVEHTGTYLEIDRPRRLVFTFSVPRYSAATTRVTIEIVPLGTGCELTLTHDGVLSE